jgi:hypothetical protein
VIDYVKLFAPLFVLLLLFKKQKGKWIFINRMYLISFYYDYFIS